MPFFLIITKLLLLKVIVVVLAYEYGYHPSAEEFDNFMRQTRHTWTGKLLDKERQRSWHGPFREAERRSDQYGRTIIENRVGEYYVPKYQYERPNYAYDTTLNLKWPGTVEKVSRKPMQLQNVEPVQAASSATAVHVAPPPNIGSSLDFTMFSDEKFDENISEHHFPNEATYKPNSSPLSESIQTTSESVFNANLINMNTDPLIKPTKIKGTVIEIANGSSERAQGGLKNPWTNKYSLNNIYQNNSEAHFPIFFTNPVTGIVYAITEIGRMNQTVTKHTHRKDNKTIPIYITKEQYDHDIALMKKKLESECSNKPGKKLQASSALSGTTHTTTHRPKIIKQKPATTKRPSISKLPIGKQPIKEFQNKPPPVMVQTGLTVSDQVQGPPPKRKQKLKGKKKKKKKRPGRKSTPTVVQNVGKGEEPHIVMGTKTAKASTSTITTKQPNTTKQQLAAQLERPNLPTTTTTIFSQRPIAATSGYVIPKTQILKQTIKQAYANPTPASKPYPNHRLKRSLPNENSTTAKALTTSTATVTLPPQPMTKTAADQNVGVTRFRLKKKGLPKLASNVTKLAAGQLGNHHQNNTLVLVGKRQKKTSTKKQPKTTQRNLSQNQTITKTTNQHQRKSTKRDKDDDDGFDLFDLFEDDDHSETEKNDDDDDDDEAYYYDDDEKGVNTTKKPKRHIIYINHDLNAAASIEDEESSIDNESINELKEPNTHENSSSAEESADFGALEEVTPQLDGDDFLTATKQSNGKKRIRRRPASSSASDEDYDDRDDSDDAGGGGGVGDFFRMIFYPVQVVMTRVFDTFAGPNGNDASDEEPTYPTYTQYSGVHRIDASAEDDEAQGNSLSSWFGYLFGFNRRTKKIGSTTAAPPTPTTTEAPGWFESWFGGSKTTSSAESSVSSEDYDDYDKWFSSWFNTKPKAKKRTATTSTTTTAATVPQVPILTIVDPMRNPQNWLGILASHMINSTTMTTTHNPIIQAFTRATTTENPDVPRYVSYDKYQIWRLKPQDEAQVKAIDEYKKSDEGAKLQWLKGPSMRGLTDVLVSPKMIVDFQGALQFESIAHEILIFDVGKAIAYEQNKEQFLLNALQPTKHRHKQKYASLINMSWNKYHAYDDIVKYLESVRMRHPQIVELFHIGRSYEGRPLIVAKLEMKHAIGSTQSGSSSSTVIHKKLRHKKKSGHASAVFIEAGTHGLEWIGPATATWMINEVLRLMKSNKTTPEVELVRNTTWYIMPVLNPDGYVYSHEYDRFWRKSRSRHVSRPNGILDSAMSWLQQGKPIEKVCYGVDLDRNWHYQWGKRGSSKAPCNEHYAGPTPFSEPESKALSEFLMDNRKQIKLFLSMQAYGQIISYPIKANVTFDSERIEDFMDVAMVGTDGLRKKGSKARYKLDASNDLTEHRAGCSDAFAAFEVGTPFSYTLYLADNGVHGYLLPSSSIEPTARDAFEIVTAMLDYI